MPSDALDLTGVQLSHTAAGAKIKAYFSPVRSFLRCCIASAWLEVLCCCSVLHHSFAGARCTPGAQRCFFSSGCRIWHWTLQTGYQAWILIRPGMQREGALHWLTGWEKHLTQRPEGRSHPSLGETVPMTARETTASTQSCGDCAWWHVLVKEQRLAGSAGGGRQQHHPKSILNSRCFRFQNSAGYSLETTTAVPSEVSADLQCHELLAFLFGAAP